MRRRSLTALALLPLLSPVLAMADLSTFSSAIATHMSSIERRDSAAFESTLTTGPTLTFVSLGGKVTRTTDEFKRQMRAWFLDTDWSWRVAEVSTAVVEQTGVAVFKVHYTDKDSAGKPYELNYILSLVFVKEGSHWRLVHDQNTRVLP
jgi:ketosteroid isomerase-like protein